MADYLRQLAEAGGLCDRCGGVHTPRIDEALLADAAGLPLCECDDCARCQKVRNALMELTEDDDSEDEPSRGGPPLDEGGVDA